MIKTIKTIDKIIIKNRLLKKQAIIDAKTANKIETYNYTLKHAKDPTKYFRKQLDISLNAIDPELIYDTKNPKVRLLRSDKIESNYNKEKHTIYINKRDNSDVNLIKSLYSSIKYKK